MSLRSITCLALVLCSLHGLTAKGESITENRAIAYDEPEPGKYRWNVVRFVKDTAPVPGHDTSFPVHNSDGLNVPYMEHVFFAITTTPANPLTNSYADLLYTHYDFDEDQVTTINFSMDQEWANSGLYPVPTRVADASIVYNCFAFALGYTDRAINDIRLYTSPGNFPISGVPDWRALQGSEKPSRATHGYRNAEHGSIVSQEMRTAVINGNSFSYEVNVYTGKYGETGVYESDGAAAPECIYYPSTNNLKQK